MSTTAVKELAERKVAKAKEAQEIIARVESENRLPTEAERDDVKRLVKEAQDAVEKMRAHEDFANYVKMVEGLADDSTIPSDQAGDGSSGGAKGGAKGRKSIGRQFVESAAYKGMVANLGRPGQFATVEDEAFTHWKEAVEAGGTKATFTVSGATLTGYDRQPGVVLVGTQRPRVADLFAQGRTSMPTIRYVQEDTFTNAATEVAEGNTKPEASWDTSEVDAAVRKIAVTAKVTDELFADFPAMESYINERLPYMVQLREDGQLMVGDGIAPNLLGLLNVSGIQTQAKGTDPTPTAFYKAIIKVLSVGYFDPDGIVMNPNDWQDIRTLTTADGLYIWGSPAEAGPERMWGLPVALTTAITANTGAVGAFRIGAQIFYRQGIVVESTNSNEDDFEKNLITLRAEQREAVAWYRPKAFCTVTGI